MKDAIRLVWWVWWLAGCRQRAGDRVFRPLQVGVAVPVYAVRVLDRDSIRIKAGEPLTLVNIWATWCIPCRKEFPDLERLHRDYDSKGLRVVAVSVDQGGDQEVRSFVSGQGATFAVGRDPEKEIERAFRSVGVPETFLIGPDGILLWRKIGALSAGGTDARAEVDAALGRQTAASH